MAKNVKQQNGQDGHGVSAIRGNGYDPEVVRSLVGRIENLQEDILIEKDACKERCDAIREDLGAIFAEAKGAGVPSKELKAALKRRALALQLDRLRDKMKGAEVDNYDHILLALGDLADLPLGQHAASKAPDAPAHAH